MYGYKNIDFVVAVVAVVAPTGGCEVPIVGGLA